MSDKDKTKEELIEELHRLRRRVVKLEEAEDERRRAEEALAEERNLLRIIIDNLPDYVYIKDTESRYLVSNIAHARFLGVTTPDEVIGKSVFELYPPELAAQYYADDQKVIRSGQPLLNREERSVDRAGNSVWLLTSKVPLRDSDGKIIGLVGIARDITERKQAEEALRLSEERFALAVQGANDGIWDWDIQNNSLYWSPRMKELLGYTDDELDIDFETFESLLHPDDREMTQAAIEAHLKDRVPFDVEQRMRAKSGEYRWFNARGQAVWDEDGRPIRMVGAGTDITERKQAEAKLKRRATQLQAVAEVSRTIISVLDPDELVRQVVNLVRERFDLYYVGLFLLDEEGRFAVLRAGTGEAGRKMLEAGHKLKVGGESMIGWCIANAQARIALDVGEEAVRFDNPLLPETRSEMALPLISRGQVIGAMTIQSTQAAAFSEEDISVLQTMADQLANAIENARLFEETRYRADQLRVVNEVGRTLASILDLDTLLEQVVRLIRDTFDYYQVTLALIEDNTLVPKSWAGALSAFPVEAARLDLSTGESIVAKVALSGTSLLVPDVRQDPSYVPLPGLEEVQSELTVPLKSKDQVIGILDVESDHLAAFDERDLTVLEALAGQIAVAIENARLFEQTRRTGFLLGLRVKELACLNDIGHKIEETPPVPEFLQWVAGRIPPAMQYPEVCLAAVEFEDRVYGAAEAVKLPCQMVQALRIGGKVVGRIYISYTEKLDFLDEESALLGDIVRRVSGYIESRRLFEQTQEALAETEALYRAGRAIGEATSVQDIVRGAAEVAVSLGFSACSLTLITATDEKGVPIQGDIYSILITGDEMIPIAPISSFPITDRMATRHALEDPDFVLIYKDSADPRITIPDKVRETMRNTGMRGMVTAGLSARGQPLGFLTFSSAMPLTDFPQEHVRRIRTVADQIAVAVETQRLLEQTQEALAETQMLYEIAREINTVQEREDPLRAMLRRVSDTGVDRCLIGWYEETEGEQPPSWMDMLAIYDPEHGEMLPTGQRVSFEDMPALRRAWESAPAPLVYNEVEANPEIDPALQKTLQKVGIRAFVSIPLMWRGRPVGGLAIERRRKDRFSDDEIRLYQTIAAQAAPVLQNIRLLEQTQAALAETEALYQASTELNAAQTYDDILTVLRKHTLLSQADRNVTIDMFNRPWTEEQMPEWADVLARWTRIPPEVADSRHFTSPAWAATLQPDAPAIITDIESDPRIDERTRTLFTQRFQARCTIFVPLVVGGQWIGYINGIYSEPTEFPEAELRFLMSLSGQAAVAVQNIRLLEQAQAHAEELSVLNEMGRALTTVLDVDAVIENIYRHTSRLMDATNFYVALYDPQQDLVSFPFYAEGEQIRQAGSRRAGNGLTEYVLRTREPLLLEENVSAQVEQLGCDQIGREAQSWLGVPMTIGERVIGVIAVQSYTTPRTYNEHHRDLLSAVAGQAAIAIENARLFQETRARAEREHIIREITDQMQRATDVETLMRITAEELNRALGGSRTYVHLGSEL